MKPTLERSDQVVAHVVAWHNRHPLAQRITSRQVHSVGVVSLPFAVRGARHAALEAAAPPADASPVDAAPLPPVQDAPPSVEAVPQAAEDPTAEPAAATDTTTDTAIEAVVEFEPDPGSEASAAPGADAAPAPPPEAPTILDRALDTPPAPSGGLIVSPPGAEEPFVTGLPPRPADLPLRPPPWHPRTWWARLRGQSPFHALFSEDFIAPFRPRQVRAWAARHGVGRRPLEPQAPQRLVVLDTARRRAGDDAPEVDLHLITAAIGVGDSRHRLLLAPDGAVLGRRRLNRPRVAAAAASALALLAGLGGGWMWRSGAHDAEAVAHHAAPASAAASASAPASATAVSVAQAASPPASSAGEVDPTASATSHPGPIGSSAIAGALPASQAVSAHAHASADPQTSPPASAPASTHAAAEAASAPDAGVAAAPPEAVASAPRSVNPRRGRIDLPPLVPRLAATERHELRTNSRELRGQPAVQADVKAWALVTGPLADRRQSERVAAQLHAIALLQPVPMRAELMPAGNGWRAVFWPFPTAQDAEKVRLALADKGLRTEVLEF